MWICGADDSIQDEETGTEGGLKSASSKGSPCMTGMGSIVEAMVKGYGGDVELKGVVRGWMQIYEIEGVWRSLWERTTEVVSREMCGRGLENRRRVSNGAEIMGWRLT